MAAAAAIVVVRSSSPVHEDVHLHAYKLWYNGKYSHIDDAVTEDQWDQIEAAKLSITIIKGGLEPGEWGHLGIPFGIGKNLTRRAGIFEAKVTSKEWNFVDSQFY